MKKNKKRDQTNTEALRRDNTQSKDCTLPVEERAYRLQVVEEFLKAGIPLRKIDELRPPLEKQGYRLKHHSNIKEYIPMIYKQEIQRVKAEIGRLQL